MLAEDGQLCLNISHSSSSSSSFRRKPASAQQRWAMKKQRAEKRRVSSSEVKGHSFKKRREEPEAPPPEVKGHSFKKKREEPEAPPPEVKGHSFKKRREEPEAPPPEVKGHVSPEIKPIGDAVHQAPPPEDTDQTPEKKKKKKKTTLKKEKDGGLKEAGPKGVKTSSLFKHNPQIPQMDIPVVSPLKEQIFSSSSFSVLDLHPHLVATLDKVLNVSTLTSVQKQTVPVLLSGRDAVVRSQTGSGKTLSYAVPVVQSLQALRPKVSRSHGPLALVIVPTRELAVQTFQTFQTLLKPFTWIVPGVLMGGEKRKAEKARLRKGINILVSTPGRLVDHVKHTLSLVFSSVRWLVLDEADRTLDLGFEKDLTVIFNSLNSTGPSRQNVLLSATLTNGVTRLADICLNDPVAIHVSGPASFDSTPTPVVKPDPDATDQSQSFAIPEALQQFVVVVPSKVRLVCLAAFILDKCKFSQDNKLIVFASSCQMVEFLHSLFSSVLCRPSANHQAELSFLRLHGNMKQEERSEVFQQFSAARSGVLLCTDVAARGLHLPQVTWIVQFTPPTAAADYVHRVGRTARVGHRGSSLLFLTPAENAFVTELANHNISLSEMKLLDILSSLMMDDTYKGRGKYHSQSSASAREQEVRERATVLQTQLEDAVHADAQTLQTAKAALQSFVRAYAAYPARLKHIFHVRSLHLGHAAKSFGLRDAPRGLGVAAATHNRKSHHGKQNQNQRQRAGKTPRADPPGKKRYSDGQRESGLICSEFSSGLDTLKKNKKKKRRKALIGQTAEGEEPE